MSGHEHKAQIALAALERRVMFKRVTGGLVSGLAVAALGDGLRPSVARAAAAPLQVSNAAPTSTDLAILNFALNLEYLEAEYYLNAVLGTGLSAAQLQGGSGQPGGTPVFAGGTKVPFQTSLIQEYAADIAADEQAHVLFLKSALGANAVPAPVLDVSADGAFTTLARAAGIVGPQQVFNPYADELSFLLGAFIFEDVGVTAYAGAAALISQASGLVQYAASILAVEAYHAGTVRTILAQTGHGPATDAIANLRSQLATGANAGTEQGDDFGTLSVAGQEGPPPVDGATVANRWYPSPYGGTVVLAPVDMNALAYRRSVAQVLNIVYGNTAAQPGLFFPNGLSTQPGVTGFS